jgi:hypothetical protein
MARTRYIKPGLCCNETLGAADADIHFTFACLSMYADREGRLEDRPMRLKTWIHPYRAADMDAHLQWLHDHRFILRYAINGDKYIQILKFLNHQKPHKTEKPSEIPPPPKNNVFSPLNNGSLTVKDPLDNGSLTAVERPLLPYNLSTLVPLNEKGNTGTEPVRSVSFFNGHEYLTRLKGVASWLVWVKPANKLAHTVEELQPVFAQFEALVAQYGDLFWPVALAAAPRHKSVSQMLNELPKELAEKYPTKAAPKQETGPVTDWSHMVNE